MVRPGESSITSLRCEISFPASVSLEISEAVTVARRIAWMFTLPTADSMRSPRSAADISREKNTTGSVCETCSAMPIAIADLPFDGRAANAMPAVEAGFFFSVPPSVVRSPQKQKLVRRLPLTSLLVETDSPVLGPEPGVRNEPANVRISVGAIAQLKGVSEDEVVEAVEENQRRLFGL